MTAFLTSSLGGYRRKNGIRIPEPLPETNGFLHRLRSVWPKNARVMVIPAEPDAFPKNDNICACFQESFPMSGLSISQVQITDSRTPEIMDEVEYADVLILTGGHVPTQNRFLKELRLRERLPSFRGILLAWSAGSMNCADTVYAGPELEGEAVEPMYERWLTGLGITDINIFPHMQSLRDELLDGMRLIEDITYADSVGHEFLALNDGSYLLIEDKETTVYGESYWIRDRKMELICRDGQSASL